MISEQEFEEINEKIHYNDERINVIHSINQALNERQQIESNIKSLNSKYQKLTKDENQKRTQFDHSRKMYLDELETQNATLCKEHLRLLHQIEHMRWHIDGCATKHRQCHSVENIKDHLNLHHHHHHRHGKEKLPKLKAAHSTPSCQSSASYVRPSEMANLKNSSERLIKSIIDIRKRIYLLQDQYDHELERKKEVEKKLSDTRKDISKQKKFLSMRKATPLPSIHSGVKKSACVK